MADPVRFYLDQHIPSAVAQGLRLRGVDVLTAQEAGRCGLGDQEQLEFANSGARVIVTHDADYLALAAEAMPHAGIAYCHATKYAVGQLIRLLLLLHGVMDAEEMRNHVEYL